MRGLWRKVLLEGGTKGAQFGASVASLGSDLGLKVSTPDGVQGAWAHRPWLRRGEGGETPKGGGGECRLITLMSK